MTDLETTAHFAAHAPPVPDWFAHEKPGGRRTKPSPESYFATKTVIEDAKAWMEDGSWDFDTEDGSTWTGSDAPADFKRAGEFVADVRRWWDGRTAWAAADEMARLTQWAVHYATAMASAIRKATE